MADTQHRIGIKIAGDAAGGQAALVETAEAADDLARAADEASNALGDLGAASGDAGDALSDLGDAGADAGEALGDIGDAGSDAGDALGDLGGAGGEAGGALGDLADAAGSAGDALGDLSGAGGDAGDASGDLDEAAGDASGSLGDLDEAAGDAGGSLGDLSDASDDASGSLDELGDAAGDAGDAAGGAGDDAGDASGDIDQLGESSGQAADLVDDLKRELLGLVGLQQIKQFASDAVAAYREQESAIRGLSSVAENEGVAAQVALARSSEIVAQGFLNQTAAAKSLQNLLSRGYSLDEAVQSIKRLTDAAVDNRAAHLSVSEAVKTATDGLRNENSILVDNAGVTKNVSVLWKEYAEEIGVGVQSLTQQQKVQAEVNGILRETEAQVGAAAKALQGLEGQIARSEAAWHDLMVATGEGLAPAVGAFADTGTAFTDNLLKPFLAAVQTGGANVASWVAEATALGSAIANLDMSQFVADLERIEQIRREVADDIRESYGLSRLYTVATDEAAEATAEILNVWERINQAQAKAAGLAQTAAQEAAAAAAAVLGIDLAQISTGISAAEREIIDAFSTLTGNPFVNGEQLVAAYSAALAQLGPVAIEEVGEAWKAAEITGLISQQEMEGGLAALAARARELAAGMDTMGNRGVDAMRRIAAAAGGVKMPDLSVQEAKVPARGDGRAATVGDIVDRRAQNLQRFRDDQIDTAEFTARDRQLDRDRMGIQGRNRPGAGAEDSVVQVRAEIDPAAIANVKEQLAALSLPIDIQVRPILVGGSGSSLPAGASRADGSPINFEREAARQGRQR